MSWIIYTLVLIAYYALHSLMASEFIKSKLHQVIGLENRGYRLFFNLVAIGTTLPVLWLFEKTKVDLVANGHISGYLLMTLGVVIVLRALVNYDILAFVGLKSEESSDKLITSGLNKYSRHPLYLGIIIALFGLIVVAPSSSALITFSVTLAYVYLGIYLEEQKLIALYKESYQAYQSKVPKLWPFKFLK